MSTLSFEKWEGLGNDFILLEASLDAVQAIALCDRRRGIGADGVLLIGRDDDGSARMTVLNADGSRPEMCGNGLRCVAGYLDANRRTGNGSDNQAPRSIRIKTDAGERVCSVSQKGTALWQVAASMGEAQLTGTLPFPADGGHSFTLVDVGNPHAVSFEVYGDEPLDDWGPAMQQQVAGGINVELCRVRQDSALEVLVWERGVGRTQACGTGACAVAAVAAAQGRTPFDEAVSVVLPGGPLDITVAQAGYGLTMSGPARQVFRGSLQLD